jgi:PAS domain S-box-containing protein
VLVASEELLRSTLEHMPAAVAIVDRDLRYLYVSARWVSGFGLGEGSVIGQNVDEALPWLPERWKEAQQCALITGAGAADEDCAARPDGSLEWLRWSVEPWKTSAGAVGGLLLFVEFITENKEAERALRASYEHVKAARTELEAARREADAATRLKSEFLALLGHELRNPLAPILTALELMKIREPGAPSRERAVIERQVEHLVCLVDDLLDLSRITRGEIELRKQPVEISDLLSQAVELASPLLERRSHNLNIAVASRGLLVDADDARLVQVFTNLLTNAAKYTEPGGQITVSAGTENGMVVVRVRDSGCGIASEMIPHIFDMFVQGERTLDRSRGGLGIGLTIVRNLVEMHGGAVSAESDGPGRGSEFVVELPSVSQQLLDLPAPRAFTSTWRSTALGRRVLVVDDNTDAAETLADILREHGHETSIAHDGPTALTKALVFRPDVALLDIGLPVMDGYELARRFREQPELKRVHLLAVTGYGQQEDKERSRAAGFEEHLVKPIDFCKLRELIDQSLPVSSDRPVFPG